MSTYFVFLGRLSNRLTVLFAIVSIVCIELFDDLIQVVSPFIVCVETLDMDFGFVADDLSHCLEVFAVLS